MLLADDWVFWFYVALMLGTWGYAAVMFSAWLIRRGPMPFALCMLFFWIGLDLMARALLRSRFPRISDDGLFFLGRWAMLMATVFGFLVVDAYLAKTNAHLSLLRRIWQWWDRRHDKEARKPKEWEAQP